MATGYVNRGMDTVVLTGADNDQTSFKHGPLERRTKLEKGLLFIVVVFFLVVVGLIIALTSVKESKYEDVPDICITADCAQATTRILEYMNLSADPCNDFYTYSCGSWKRKFVIPEDKSGYGVFSMTRDKVQVINKYLLEDSVSYPNVTSVTKAKKMFASCLDLDQIEERNTTVAIPLLEELGGWPVLDSNPGGNWLENNFSLPQLMILLRKYNNRPVIDIYVSSDVKKSDNNTIYLDQPGFGLPGRSYYVDDSLAHMREAYVTLAVSTAVLFGANETAARKQMEDVLALETDLANISMKSEERRDDEKLYNKMTILELKHNFTEPTSSDAVQFDWLEYISGIMGLDGVDIAVNESEHVVVTAVPYFQKLFDVLQKYDKRVVANYAVWYIMKNRINNLDSRFKYIITTYYKVIYGTASSSARWRECVDYTVGLFGMAVGHMFVKETFDETAKEVALDMIGNISNSFNELLDEADWMDEPTKVLAREKLDVIREWIGYPDDILEAEAIDKLYENATVDRNEYFKNILNNLMRTAVNGLRDLRKMYRKDVWTTPPSTVNAFYSPILNTMMFPAGILQPPFYSKSQPKSMNYGSIGVVIGHEITHGFDDRGRQYDKDGNLHEWWDATIIENFKEKAQCIVDQYDQFVVPEANISLNGINTQGENIADNGGLKQSFRAYRNWVKNLGHEEPLLPGVNFTHSQLFFISFAQIFCTNVREEGMIRSIKTGVHSPGQYRAIGTLQNSPEFSTAFNCKSGQAMNPPKKCSVW